MAAAAGIAAAGSILSGAIGGKGASKAAKIQADAYRQGLAQQQAQYAQTQANEQPFLNLGTQALSPLSALSGLSGNDAQQQAIAGLQSSPLFTSADRAGTDALLQNAAATGGLRGGNTESALYNNRAGLLSAVIQNQLGNLTGLAGIGSNAAGALGNFGQANATASSNLLGNIGNAQASGVLGGATATGRTINDLSGILQTYLQNRNLGGGGGAYGIQGSSGIW